MSNAPWLRSDTLSHAQHPHQLRGNGTGTRPPPVHRTDHAVGLFGSSCPTAGSCRGSDFKGLAVRSWQNQPPARCRPAHPGPLPWTFDWGVGNLRMSRAPNASSEIPSRADRLERDIKWRLPASSEEGRADAV